MNRQDKPLVKTEDVHFERTMPNGKKTSSVCGCPKKKSKCDCKKY